MNNINQEREKFFKGIAEMLSNFSENDLKRMKAIHDNEILRRRKGETDKTKRIIIDPLIISRGK